MTPCTSEVHFTQLMLVAQDLGTRQQKKLIKTFCLTLQIKFYFSHSYQCNKMAGSMWVEFANREGGVLCISYINNINGNIGRVKR